MNGKKQVFLSGMQAGVPIGTVYFAVAFSLGIIAQRAGLNPFQGFVSSVLVHASAGEYAEFTAIAGQVAYIEMVLVILIANARYLLMSCALSQRFAPDAPLGHRILVGFGITDEIFGVTIARPGVLDPWYTYGAMALSIPLWALGTALGIAAGNILPAAVVGALSVALYGMFLAIIIPPARKSRVIGVLVPVSFAASYALSLIPVLRDLSDSMRTILLTLLIAGGAAALFPVQDEEASQ